MKPSAKNILDKYNKAWPIKSTWDTEYRKVFEYAMPARDQYQKAQMGESINPEFQDRRENQFSSVGEQSASEFVNTMQEVLCPPMSKWIALEAGMRIPEEDREAVNLELEKLTDIANEYKNNSSYDLAFSEFCYDVFAGTGCMLVLPGTTFKPLTFKAIPIREYCIDEGPNGEVYGVYRKFDMKREFLGDQWKELQGKTVKRGNATKSGEDITLLESTYYDSAINKYHYQVIDFAEKTELVHREYTTNPFIVLRWNKCAGEPYGRGVGITALNDIKTLNLIKEYSLRNFAYNIPPLLVQEDAMLDVDGLELTPFSLNVVPDTKTSIVPLQISTDHNIESYKVQELTMNIKRNTFGTTLPNEGSRELTATEVNAREMELRRNLNSVFGRLTHEYQIPLVRRIYDVMMNMKVLDKEFEQNGLLDNINGLIWKVKVNTPLARQLQVGEAQSIMAATQFLFNLDPTGQLMSTMVKSNEMAAHLLGLLGVPARFVNAPQEMAANQTGQAAQAAQQQGAALEADVAAENAKALGKEQAKVVAENEAI